MLEIRIFGSIASHIEIDVNHTITSIDQSCLLYSLLFHFQDGGGVERNVSNRRDGARGREYGRDSDRDRNYGMNSGQRYEQDSSSYPRNRESEHDDRRRGYDREREHSSFSSRNHPEARFTEHSRDRDRRRSFDEPNSRASDRDRRRSFDEPNSRASDRDYYRRPPRDCDPCEDDRGGFDGRRREKRWREDGDGRGDGDRKRRMDRRGGPREEGMGRVKTRKKMWPPCFESAGASYVFDARSGLFYEASSDFFYDPKKKLYYGNRLKAYFKYSEDDSPPFVEVPQPEAEDGMGMGNTSKEVVDNPQDLVVQALQGGKNLLSDKKPEKNKIAICIKQKTLKSSKKPLSVAKETEIKTDVEASAPSQAEKERETDMEKWSQRVQEMRDEDSCREATPTKVKMTASGQPMCVLCQRKFASVDKLRQHEKLSKLHQHLLAKKKKRDLQKAATKTSNPEYRDRAQERRTMYVPESTTSQTIDQSVVDMGPSLDKARTVVNTETVAPEQSLGESNVGNKLLRSLGWKGGSLGRANEKNDGETEKGDVKDNLKQDWERIETIAARKR